MTRMKYFLLIIPLLLFSGLFVPQAIRAEGNVIPSIGDGLPSPIIDGNLTEVSWNTSVVFETKLFQQNTTIKVTTNGTNLFIGFNISMTNFLPVNDTVPAFNNTIANYTLGYNNQTHDWFAVVIDNNLDRVVGNNFIGTASAPDDVVVIDQYNSTAYDGYANGSREQLFIPDAPIRYNGSVDASLTAGANGEIIPLNINGTELISGKGSFDATVARLNITKNGINYVSYEITKPLDGSDPLGYDFDLSASRILQFKLMQWKNSAPNATLKDNVESTDWYSLRINETGTGLALKTAGNTTINFITSAISESEYDAVKTLLDLYGFDVTVTTASLVNQTFDKYDVNIFLFGTEADITDADVDALTQYVRTGGTAIVLFSSDVAGVSNKLAEKFELEFLPNDVIVPISANETSTLLNISGFTDILPLESSASLVTDQVLSKVQFSSAALNVTNVFAEDNHLIQGQEFMAYNLFDAPADAVYDQTDDGLVNDTESFNGLSLGLAMDLLKGGRITFIPSTSLISDVEMVNEDNMAFFLKLLPWSSRIVNILDVQSTSVDKLDILTGETVTITVNATDGFGNVIPSDAEIVAEFIIFGNIHQRVVLKQVGDSSIYSAEVQVEKNGFLEVEITASSPGFGFAEGQTLNIYVKQKVQSFNDLSQLSFILATLFILSTASAIYAILKVKNVEN